jgi:hypothetical protein
LDEGKGFTAGFGVGDGITLGEVVPRGPKGTKPD